MELFSLVDDAAAIVRMPKGVLKQTKVYHRGSTVYVPHAGGFVRVTAMFGTDPFTTSHPDIKVVEIEGPGISIDRGAPRYDAPLRAAA